MNIAGSIWAARTGKNYSWVPFLGGVFAVVALLTLPIDGTARFWWIPLIVDITITGFLYAVIVDNCFELRKK